MRPPPRFRPPFAGSAGPSPPVESLEQVRRLIAQAVAPAQFFVGADTALEWEHAVREISWEIFQGRLLDPVHTTTRQIFEEWNVFLSDGGGRSAEPLLSVKLDAAAGQVHVVRAVLCYAWEGYQGGDNDFLSRETRRWVRELVGTICLDHFGTEDELGDEIICQLFQAIVGTSRLPLTSIEAPLPAFSLGRLAYFYRPDSRQLQPASSWGELFDRLLISELSWLEKAKLLETLLHAAPAEGLAVAADRFAERWRMLGHAAAEIPALFRTLFNEVSLSPWTGLVDRAFAFLRSLEQKGHLRPLDVIDLLAHLLRQNGRHLTAYDLVTFHHFGANYPDALLLDALLREYFSCIEQHPEHFLEASVAEEERNAKRLRRRALRQGYLLRRRYEGHLVPDAPTSQGENQRVLPSEFPRVPEEQIVQPHRRTRQLFDGDPLAAHLGEHGRLVLEESIRDLHHPHEQRELGMALFLDRPLGALKGPVEPDRTPLLSYEAFSRTIALRRLDWLEQNVFLSEPGEYARIRQELQAVALPGIRLEQVVSVSRPGTVSLADARRVADDFILLRTTRRATADFLALFDFTPLATRSALDWLTLDRHVLIVGEMLQRQRAEVLIRIHDADLRLRLELSADFADGYAQRAGIEYPANGLRVGRVWEESDRPGELRQRDLSSEGVLIRA